LFSESENNKPTSGTNSGVLGPVAFWMIVWMSPSVKSSQGSTSCIANHVTSDSVNSVMSSKLQSFFAQKYLSRCPQDGS
jgi:hypothetical protein